jgi:hypothetical protein
MFFAVSNNTSQYLSRKRRVKKERKGIAENERFACRMVYPLCAHTMRKIFAVINRKLFVSSYFFLYQEIYICITGKIHDYRCWICDISNPCILYL